VLLSIQHHLDRLARLLALFSGATQLLKETMPNAYRSIFTLADDNRIRKEVREDTQARREVLGELGESGNLSEVRENVESTAGQRRAGDGLGRFREAVA
jgi:hypothetical protein